jgi:prepilin-type N-terminal cleavage/methylation domain-containing protein
MRLRGQHGFTLVEVLVTAALALVVFGAMLSVLDVFGRDNRLDQLRNETQDNARSAVDSLSRQLRNVAAPGSGTPGALLVTKNYSMIFDTIDSSGSSYVWENNATHMMMVRYCLSNKEPSNEVLWYQVRRWKSSTPPPEPSPTKCPDEETGFWEGAPRRLVTYVTNRNGGKARPLFEYSAATAPQTASVEMNMFLNVAPTQIPETQLTTGIGLRNANRPPVAEFTATEINNRNVRLDASASADPDGLALTFKWTKDGVAQESMSETWETLQESIGSHTYELEVTDPGGLKSKQSKTIKVQ